MQMRTEVGELEQVRQDVAHRRNVELPLARQVGVEQSLGHPDLGSDVLDGDRVIGGSGKEALADGENVRGARRPRQPRPLLPCARGMEGGRHRWALLPAETLTSRSARRSLQAAVRNPSREECTTKLTSIQYTIDFRSIPWSGT